MGHKSKSLYCTNKTISNHSNSGVFFFYYNFKEHKYITRLKDTCMLPLKLINYLIKGQNAGLKLMT